MIILEEDHPSSSPVSERSPLTASQKAFEIASNSSRSPTLAGPPPPPYHQQNQGVSHPHYHSHHHAYHNGHTHHERHDHHHHHHGSHRGRGRGRHSHGHHSRHSSESSDSTHASHLAIVSPDRKAARRFVKATLIAFTFLILLRFLVWSIYIAASPSGRRRYDWGVKLNSTKDCDPSHYPTIPPIIPVGLPYNGDPQTKVRVIRHFPVDYPPSAKSLITATPLALSTDS